MANRAMQGRESAWIVKGRTDWNDLANDLKKGRVAHWVTKRPPKDLLEGDLAFLWTGAPKLAVCGVAEVIAIHEPDRHGVTQFDLRYLTGYLDELVGIAQLRADPTIGKASFLKTGPSGTLFPLTGAQANRLLLLVTRLNKGISIKPRAPSGRTNTTGLALSIRQPYVEQILQGTKLFEYRSFPTHKRGRVMVYASKQPGEGDVSGLPTGVIVGSVEIVGSKKLGERDYAWVLRRPIRLKRARVPTNQAQPAYFRPFKRS